MPVRQMPFDDPEQEGRAELVLESCEPLDDEKRPTAHERKDDRQHPHRAEISSSSSGSCALALMPRALTPIAERLAEGDDARMIGRRSRRCFLSTE